MRLICLRYVWWDEIEKALYTLYYCIEGLLLLDIGCCIILICERIIVVLLFVCEIVLVGFLVWWICWIELNLLVVSSSNWESLLDLFLWCSYYCILLYSLLEDASERLELRVGVSVVDIKRYFIESLILRGIYLVFWGVGFTRGLILCESWCGGWRKMCRYRFFQTGCWGMWRSS